MKSEERAKIKEARGMGIVEGYLFGKLVGEINTNVKILREKLRKISSLEKLDEISRAVYLVESEKILGEGMDFIKSVYNRRNSFENQFKKNENIGMCRTIASELDKGIKDYEQARKELCYFVTNKKPWGQE